MVKDERLNGKDAVTRKRKRGSNGRMVKDERLNGKDAVTVGWLKTRD